MIDEDEKIAALEQKIAELKKPQQPKSAAIEKNSSVAVRVVADLASGIFVGFALGYGLDYALGTKPVFLLIFIIIGVAAGFLNIYRGITKEETSS